MDPGTEEQTSRQKLLKAGLAVFSERGYHGAKTKLIAQTAGVNESLIMRHFKSKDGLFLAVITEHVALDFTITTYPPQDTLLDELTRYARAVWTRDEAQPEILRLVIGHSMVDRDFMSRLVPAMNEKSCAVLTPRLKNLRARGLVPADVNLGALEHAVARTVFASVFFSMLMGVVTREDSLAIMNATIRSLVEGVERGRFRVPASEQFPE